MPQITVRRIRSTDGQLLQALRLRSLSDDPNAFGQSAADAMARDQSDWLHQARQASEGDRRAWFIAEDANGRGVGLVQGRRRPPAELLIFSMWVDAELRRAGIGRQLMDAVESWARQWGATHSVLWVFGTNEPAIRFYRRLGFSVELETDDADSGRSYGALAMSRSPVERLG